jgi:deoxyribose-phosphate aldolase
MAQAYRIAIGADHGGYDLKQQLVTHLVSSGHAVHDCGTGSREPVDYPVYAAAVARVVAAGACDFGIAIDGAGIGSAMTANKVPGVLAAACYTEALARNSREHNDANVLTLGAGQVSFDQARAIVDLFLSTACTADRHRARVRMIRELERGAMATSSPGGADLSPEDIRRVADRVRQLLEQGGGGPGRPGPALSLERVASLIDHTLLKPDAMPADIERLCGEARTHRFFSVCVNSTHVRQAAGLLRGTEVKVCAVVGFPLGAQPPEIKALETRRATRDGAREIDMVINVGALKARDDAAVLKDIRAVVESCRDGRAICKVILETALLTDEEKVRGCELSMKAGADFVKTSTGFGPGGATVADVALMSRTVAPRKLGVKAAGGIRSYADLAKMVDAGATRVGSSSSVKILDEARAQGAK